jgi:hypothetical protein
MLKIAGPVEECFELAGRGTIVTFAQVTGLPVGRPLRATVIRPDGSRLQAIPNGSTIELEMISEGS